VAALALPVVLLATSCGSSPSGGDTAASLATRALPATITVRSSALDAGGALPARFTCSGEDLSPPLEWSSVPSGTAEVALVVDDPDAPNGTYVHWIVTGVDPGTAGVDEGALPSGGVVADNSAGHARYDGPCPPHGAPHRYRFTVYALARKSSLSPGSPTRQALSRIEGAATARGRLTATFAR
jgi:Raf kinase inhibitor-like YbhB/YbcL family protein